MIARLKAIAKKVLDALYPRGLVCIRCGKELGEGDRELELCPECVKTISYSIEEGNGEVVPDMDFDGVFYNVKYEGYARDMVLNYKDGGKNWLYVNIAKMMCIPDLPIDYLTYVPCHKRAIRRRGFDHAKTLAKEVSKIIGVPFIDALKRVSQTLDSANKPRTDRIKDVVGAFEVSKKLDADTLKDKTVLLIDDVLTTGATANECSKVLKSIGAKAVLVSVFARA